MIKKNEALITGRHLIPLLVFFSAALCGFFFYETLNQGFSTAALCILGVLTIYYLFTIRWNPIHSIIDAILEGIVAVLLLFSILGPLAIFLTLFPYVYPTVLLPIPYFIVYLVAYIIKIQNWKKSSQNQATLNPHKS